MPRHAILSGYFMNKDIFRQFTAYLQTTPTYLMHDNDETMRFLLKYDAWRRELSPNTRIQAIRPIGG